MHVYKCLISWPVAVPYFVPIYLACLWAIVANAPVSILVHTSHLWISQFPQGLDCGVSLWS